jgi:hypothetical protein
MKWVIIKGVRYPSSVISAFAAYNMDNPFVKIRIRNKYHIVSFDDVNKMASQMVYLMNNYPDFVKIGRWWISKKTVMSWVPKGKAVDGSGWVISFTLSFGLEGGTSKMSWAALPVEPACMGKVGEGTRRPPMFVGLAEQIKLQCSDIIKVKITI